MKIITFMAGSQATYESPATRIIEVNLYSPVLTLSDGRTGNATIQGLTNHDYTVITWEE